MIQNPEGLADAIEHTRRHPVLPPWDDAFRNRIVRALSDDASRAEMHARVKLMLTEWEARFG